MMRLAGFIFLLLLLVQAKVLAAEVAVTELAKPYDVAPLQADLTTEQFWLGELTDYPVMYELVVEATTTVRAVLRQRYSEADPIPFAFMLVKKLPERGVVEIARQRSSDTVWNTVKDDRFGMRFYEGKTFQNELVPGTYNLEVSTPVNQGRFLMIVGTEAASPSYGQTLRNIRLTQQFFGLSPFSIFTSPYVFYPIGILLLLAAFPLTWYWRKKQAYVG